MLTQFEIDKIRNAEGLGPVVNGAPQTKSLADDFPELNTPPPVQPTADLGYKGADNLTTKDPKGNTVLNIPALSNITGGKTIAEGLGQDIANKMGTQDNLAKANDQSIAIQTQLLAKIKEDKAQGKDTTRLQSALTELTQHIQDTGAEVGAIGNQNNITGKEVAGDALQLGTSLAGVGALPGVGSGVTESTGIVKGVLEGAKTGAKAGAIFGASSGVSSALKQDKSANDIVKGGVVGGLEGALSGGVLGGAVGGVSGGIKAYQANKANQDFIDKMITPPTDKGKASLTAIKTGKVKEGAGALGERDFSGALPNFDKIKESVAQVPGISPKNSHLENLNAIHDAIGSTATDLKTQLESSGATFTPNQFNKYMRGVKSTITENASIVGDAETSANKIITKFNSLVKENGYTPAGLLQARKELDSWASSGKGAGIFNPTTENGITIALKGIRQGGNNFLSNLVPDVAVKDLLAHQSNLYNAIDILASKAQKEGATYAARLIGVVRAHPIGALAATGGVTLAGDRVLKAFTGL